MFLEEKPNPRQAQILLQNATNRRNSFPVLACVERAGSPMRFWQDHYNSGFVYVYITYDEQKVQEKICTEPKEPEQALEFAIAFEEGIKRQTSYRTQITDSSKTSVKSEPVFAVARTNQRERECVFQMRNFTMEHIENCKAANCKCKHCKIVGHMEICCNKQVPQGHKDKMKRLKAKDNPMRRVNYIDENESKEEISGEEEQLVLRVHEKGHKPFYMEGQMCGKWFKAIIDTGSLVSIFTMRDLQQIIGERKVVVRDMIEDEHYVDYTKRPLKLLGNQCVRLEVAG